MLRFRIAAIASASVLGLGIAAPAFADGLSTPAPTVSQGAGGSFTVDLPGVGSLSFTVDPTTGVISKVLATADNGFTAGTPITSHEGVQVSLTSTAGTATLLQAEVDHENGTVKVEPEVETDQPDNVDKADTADKADKADNNTSTSTTDAQRQDSADSGSTTSKDSTSKDSTSKDSTSNDSQSSASSGDHGDGPTTTSTTSTTSTSSDGGSSDGASSDGGSDS